MPNAMLFISIYDCIGMSCFIQWCSIHFDTNRFTVLSFFSLQVYGQQMYCVDPFFADQQRTVYPISSPGFVKGAHFPHLHPLDMKPFQVGELRWNNKKPTKKTSTKRSIQIPGQILATENTSFHAPKMVAKCKGNRKSPKYQGFP